MLNRDFKEFIKLLNDNNVRYLVVGGYAVALHGHPRYTKDLDVWIDLNADNAANLARALFGGLREPKISMLQNPASKKRIQWSAASESRMVTSMLRAAPADAER